MNGDLRVAYRASPRRPSRHRVRPELVHLLRGRPDLPSIQGWVEAMTSLGRLIFFDQPGTGASDPVTAGALPTLEQWADSITAVLDDLGSREAVLVASTARSRLRRCSPQHIRLAPPRWSCSRVMRMRRTHRGIDPRKPAAWSPVGDGGVDHVLNPDMPWNEEIRATWARMERLAASPRTVALMMPLVTEMDVRAVLPTVRVPTLVVQHADDPIRPAREGQVHRRAHTRREIRRAARA